MTTWTLLLEAEGGLFDFDATLPLMALQFLALAALLNAVFYKPVGKAIDDRAENVRNNLVKARDGKAKAETLAQQYEQELRDVRRQSQQIIAEAQAAAQGIVAEEIQKAQQQVQAEREKAAQEIGNQKADAIRTLDAQVDVLSEQLLQKLVGAELAK